MSIEKTNWVKYSDRILINVVFIFSFLYFSLRILYDYVSGGEPWKQGDWLINSQGGPVRRSFLGDIFISLSDLTGFDLLPLVVIVQISVSCALYILVYRLILSDKTGALYLLALSSSFFLFFWTAAPQGAGRKKVLAFLAISIIAISMTRRSALLLSLGFGIYIISVLSHEAMILFLPIILSGYKFYSGIAKKDTVTILIVALSSIISLAAFCFVILNSTSQGSSVVCQSLVSRGLSAEICVGAIKWLDYDLEYGIQAVQNKLSLEVLVDLVLGYGIALAPFFIVAMLSMERRRSFTMIFASIFPFLPLYFFAIDFGRWMSFHIFSLFYLFSVGVLSKKITIKRAVDFRVKVAACLVGALCVHGHVVDMYWGGVIYRFYSDFLMIRN